MKSRFKKASASAVKAPKKPRPTPNPFDITARMAESLAALALPPPPGVERHEPVGELICRWVIPHELCPGINEQRHMMGFTFDALKKRCLRLMLDQQGGKRAPAPLAGRPMCRAIYRSSRQPDRDQGFSKLPIDRLCVGRRKRPKHITKEVWAECERQMGPAGLGWLVDDHPTRFDLRTWWEPAPPKKGCMLIELYTGAL